MSKKAREVIADEANEIFARAASAWEISVKQRLGRPDGVPRATEWFAELVTAQGELEALVLVTRDPAFAGFGSKTLW